MKIAQQLANQYAEKVDEAVQMAEAKAVAKDWAREAEITKYIFLDNSVLAIRGSQLFGMDADDADSIRSYGEFSRGADATEVAVLLEALGA